MSEETDNWLRDQLNEAATTLTETGVLDDAMIEVKPAWALPHRILVGKARRPAAPQHFTWFFSGEVGFNHLPGEVAATPRDALRHLSMKMQLEAEGMSGDDAQERIQLAHDIYDLVNDERFWSPQEPQ